MFAHFLNASILFSVSSSKHLLLHWSRSGVSRSGAVVVESSLLGFMLIKLAFPSSNNSCEGLELTIAVLPLIGLECKT